MNDHFHEPNQQIANALRLLRSARGWSLDRTAQATGVSKAMLGQIERGESSPTIATLWKIAGGFQTSLSSLIEVAPPARINASIQRRADLVRTQPGPDGMLVALLFPYDPCLRFELFELTLLPSYERLSEAHEPGVVEHVVVLRGAMDLLIDGEWRALAVGDAVRFAGDRPHGYRNRTSEPAVFHNMIHYGGSVSGAEQSSRGAD